MRPWFIQMIPLLKAILKPIFNFSTSNHMCVSDKSTTKFKTRKMNTRNIGIVFISALIALARSFGKSLQSCSFVMRFIQKLYGLRFFFGWSRTKVEKIVSFSFTIKLPSWQKFFAY